MINARFLGGGVQLSPIKSEKGGKALRLVSFLEGLPKGGLRWNNISDKGGVIYG